MTPKYLRELADLADPNKLWRLAAFDRMGLLWGERHQLDTGVALRRHADHLERLGELLKSGRSLLITPLSENGTAIKTVDTPPDHERLRPGLRAGATPSVEPPQLTEGEIGGLACNLFKRLGGTDAEWVERGEVRDSWNRAVYELLVSRRTK